MSGNTSTKRLDLVIDSKTDGAVKGLRGLSTETDKQATTMTERLQRMAREEIAGMGQMTEEGKRLLTARFAFEYGKQKEGGDLYKAALTARLGDYKQYSSQWMAVAKEIDRVDATSAKTQQDRIKAVEVQRRGMLRQIAQVAHGAGGGPVLTGIVSSTSAFGSAQAIRADLEMANRLADLASDLVEARDKMTRVFGKESAAEIESWSNHTADAMGISKRAALETAGTLGNLLRSGGITGKAGSDLTQQLIGRAADVGSFGNVDPQVVLKKFEMGINGQARPLRQLGIYLSDARIKAEAFADGIAKPIKSAPQIAQAHKAVEIAAAKAAQAIHKYGEGSIEATAAGLALDKANGRLEKALAGSSKELTEQQKIAARIAVIMKDSANQAHNFADTSNEAANAQRRLAASTEDLETALGEKLLPIKKEILSFLNDLLSKFNALDESTKNFSFSLAAIGAVAVPLAAGVGNIVLQLLRIKGAYDAIKTAKLAADVAGGIPAVGAAGAAAPAVGAAAPVVATVTLALVAAGLTLADAKMGQEMYEANKDSAENEHGLKPEQITAQKRSDANDRLQELTAQRSTPRRINSGGGAPRPNRPEDSVLDAQIAEQKKVFDGLNREYNAQVDARRKKDKERGTGGGLTDIAKGFLSEAERLEKTATPRNAEPLEQARVFRDKAAKVYAAIDILKKSKVGAVDQAGDIHAKGFNDFIGQAKADAEAKKTGAGATTATGAGGLYSGADRNAGKRKADADAKKAERAAVKLDKDSTKLADNWEKFLQHIDAQAIKADKIQNARAAKMEAEGRALLDKAAREAIKNTYDAALSSLDAGISEKDGDALKNGAISDGDFKTVMQARIDTTQKTLREISAEWLDEELARLARVYDEATTRRADDTDKTYLARVKRSDASYSVGTTAAQGAFADRTRHTDAGVERAQKQLAGELTKEAEAVAQRTRDSMQAFQASLEAERTMIDLRLGEAERTKDYERQEALIRQRMQNEINQNAPKLFYNLLMGGDVGEASKAAANIRVVQQTGATDTDAVARARRADEKSRGTDRFFVDEDGFTRDRRHRTMGPVKNPQDRYKRVDGDQVELLNDLNEAAKKDSKEFMRALFSGDKSQATLRDFGKNLGKDFANAGADFLHRKLVDGPLNRLFDGIADKLQESLIKGGASAGGAIGQAALALYDAYLLSGKAGKKKQQNAFAGALAGAALGSLAGNPLLGAQLGAGIAGSFADGGKYPTGRDILVGERGPEIVRIHAPGEIIPNHRVQDALRESYYAEHPAFRPMQSPDRRNGSFLPEPSFQIPAPQMPTLSGAGAGQALQRAVEAVRGAAVANSSTSGGYGDLTQHVTVFGGVHGDGAIKKAGKSWGSSLSDAVNMM